MTKLLTPPNRKIVSRAKVPDPVKFVELCWPHITLYDKQKEIMYSVRDNDETYVPAANMMGKDFVSALIIIWFFRTRRPCRIVTTSAKDDHLRVLWGEIGNFIQTSKVALDVTEGGDFIVNQREIRKLYKGEEEKLSYVKGMVASADKIAAMQGHHATPQDLKDGRAEIDKFAGHITPEKQPTNIPLTLFVGDEASSLLDAYYTMCSTWAKRMLIIGNTHPCENFFKHAVKGKPGTDDRGGDILAPDGTHYYRKVIHIRADDSPNVRLANAQIKRGEEPTHEIILPGVKSYEEYLKNRTMWDEVQQCVSLDAEWYEGPGIYLYPKEWLDRAEKIARENTRSTYNLVNYLGVDTAEGGDDTCWAPINKNGLIEMISKKTPDTSVITGDTIAIMKRYNILPENVIFDRGGGGKEHADRLRTQGYNVRTVAFGESVVPEPKRGTTWLSEKKENIEEKYIYKNRRAQMYHILSQLMDPINDGFGIPAKYSELRRQLSVMPKLWDGEGRLFLPPKNKRSPNSIELTIIELLGCSPDQADALVLATYGMVEKPRMITVGAF